MIFVYLIIISSFVVHYSIEEKTVSTGRVSYHSEKQGHKYLGVVSMPAVLRLKQLLYLKNAYIQKLGL